MKDIRNQDCRSAGIVLIRALRGMDVSIDAITRFSLNQFSGRYMLHFKGDRAREFTVEYYQKSWPDALKHGFLSANIGGTGRFLKNIQVGDISQCISNAG